MGEAMTAIDRVTVYTGHLEPEKPWSWVLNFVKVEAGGLAGWGEAGTTYFRPAVGTAEVLRVLAHHCLLGADPMRNGALWRRMANMVDGAYHGGAIGFGAVAACDSALWDLKGKLLGQPVHALLGGQERTRLRAYANGWCYRKETPEAYAEAARGVITDGFTALKFDPFRYDAGGFSEHPAPGENLPRRWMEIAAERVAAVREAIGPAPDLLLEAHGKFSPPVAIEIGRRFAEFGVSFFEEPIVSDRPEVHRRVADSQPIPLAGGERLGRPGEFAPFLEAQAFALAQPDLGVCGGITAGRRMAEAAEGYGVAFQPHNSAMALNTAAAFQLAASVPNFIFQETFPYRPEAWYRFFEDPYEKRLRDGYLPIPEEPGLGLSVNEPAVEELLVRQEHRS